MVGQGFVAFKDMAVYFSRDEQTLLDGSQRLLYHSVMLETFEFLASLGKDLPLYQSFLGWAGLFSLPRVDL